MVLLVTSDNEQFVVDKEVAERSVLIKNMLEGKNVAPHSPPHFIWPPRLLLDAGESDRPLLLPNVSSSVLTKVVVFALAKRDVD